MFLSLNFSAIFYCKVSCKQSYLRSSYKKKTREIEGKSACTEMARSCDINLQDFRRYCYQVSFPTAGPGSLRAD